nr:probable glucan 1,3-beta-glucosidase A [Tanacetum cinerariifolium]
MSFEEAIGRLTAFEERIKSQDTIEANDQDKLLMASSNNKTYGKWRGKDFNKEGKESMKWKNNPNARRASTSQRTKDKSKLRCYECDKSRRSVCDYGGEHWAKTQSSQLLGIVCVYAMFIISNERTLNSNYLKIRAVNLEGWLVTEGWMKPSLFDTIPNNNLLDGAALQFKSMTSGRYPSAEHGGGSIIVANRNSAKIWETFKDFDEMREKPMIREEEVTESKVEEISGIEETNNKEKGMDGLEDGRNECLEKDRNHDDEIANPRTETVNDRTKEGRFGLKDIVIDVEGICYFKFRHEEVMNYVIDQAYGLLSNIPLEAWNVKGSITIASRLWRPIKMDKMTAMMCKDRSGRLVFARVLVEINAKKECIDNIEINYVDDLKNVKKTKWVKAEYSWKPDRCNNCCVFGHYSQHCKLKPRAVEVPKGAVKQNNQADKEGFVKVSSRKNVGGQRDIGNKGIPKG